MKSKMASGELEIEHRAGIENVADLFRRFRPGIFDQSMTLLINDVVLVREIAFVELCCGTNSALREACRVA